MYSKQWFRVGWYVGSDWWIGFHGVGWWDCTKCHKRDGIKKISEEIKILKRNDMLIKKMSALKECLVGALRSLYELSLGILLTVN